MMFRWGTVTVIVGQAFVCANLLGSTAHIEPNFEKFMRYFETHYRQKHFANEEDSNLAGTIETILHARGVSPAQKQKLLLRLGQIRVNRYEEALRDRGIDAGQGVRTLISKGMANNLVSAANAFRRAVKIRASNDVRQLSTFKLALTLSRLRNDNALFYYRKLLKENTDKKLLPYVHLALAEHLYEARKFLKAGTYYRRAVGNRKHPVYPYSVYKLGWAYFHLRHKDKKYLHKSLQTFKMLLDMAGKTKKAHVHTLRKEAVSDLTYIWSDIKDVKSARRFFAAVGERDAYYLALKRTAQSYEMLGKKRRAIATWGLLLKGTGGRLENPAYLQELLELLFNTRKYQEVVQHIQKIPKKYVAKNSTWRLKNKDRADVAEILNNLQETVYQYGKYLYELGTDAKKTEARKYARKVLNVYLKTFPNTDNYLDARFLLAEILREFNFLERAAHHYLAISNEGDRDDPLMKLASLNAVDAMQKLYEQTSKNEKKGIEKKYKETLDNHLHLFPEDQESRDILMTAARMEMKYKNIPRARQRLQSVLEIFTDSMQAGTAAELVLKTMIDKKRWKEIITWVRDNQKFRPRLPEWAVQAMSKSEKLAHFRLGMQMQEEKSYQRAAKQYLRYQKLFADDKLADDALHRAGQNYYHANEVDLAIDSHLKLIDLYPRSSFVQDTLLSLARTHEKVGLFETAAKYYHTFGLRFTDSKFNYRALAKAMKYYYFLDMLDDAQLVADYIKKKFTAALPQEYYVTQANIYMKTGKYDDAWLVYRKLISSPQLTVADFIQDDFIDTVRDNGDNERLTYLTAKLRPRINDSAFRKLYAKIKFNQLQKPLEEYLAIDVHDAEQIDSAVKTKQQKLLRLIAEFEKIIKIGDPEFQISSFYKLGEMHENFANIIFNAPTLSGASQEEVDRYRTKLEKAAFPLKNEAYKYYQAAYQRAQQTEIFGEWMLRAYEKITRLYPEKHPQMIEKVNTPQYLTHKFHLSDSTKILLR